MIRRVEILRKSAKKDVFQVENRFDDDHLAIKKKMNFNTGTNLIFFEFAVDENAGLFGDALAHRMRHPVIILACCAIFIINVLPVNHNGVSKTGAR